MADECGVVILTQEPENTAYYDRIAEDEIDLPKGVTYEECVGGNYEFLIEGEPATLDTYQRDGKHITRLITSSGYYTILKKWDMKKQVLERGYITHALTNEKDEIFGLDKGRTINDWSFWGKIFYWSEVYCEAGYMARIIRNGTLLVNPTNKELSRLHEQSKINLN